MNQGDSPGTVALITGATGFVGRHLVRALVRETRWQVVGLTHSSTSHFRDERVRWLKGDLCNWKSMQGAIRAVKPDLVFHLGAATPPRPDEDFLRTNVVGTTCLLELLRTWHPSAKVLNVGSDAQYGPQLSRHIPTSERAPMRPLNAYGRSKVLQERVALSYARMAGMRVVCIRAFNHLGPGQNERLVVGALARQIAHAERQKAPATIQMGNAETARDFTDVRDISAAYILAMRLAQSGRIYNVGSGQARTIREVTDMLQRNARVPVQFCSSPTKMRGAEVPLTQADSDRFRRCTGWSPQISFEQSVADTLAYWRCAGETAGPN